MNEDGQLPWQARTRQVQQEQQRLKLHGLHKLRGISTSQGVGVLSPGYRSLSSGPLESPDTPHTPPPPYDPAFDSDVGATAISPSNGAKVGSKGSIENGQGGDAAAAMGLNEGPAAAISRAWQKGKEERANRERAER